MSIHGDVRERQMRSVRNQSIFREVNERVRDINQRFQAYTSLLDWVCECAVDSCTQRIEMATQDYDHIRAVGERFFVAPSHEHVWPDVELVVERHPKYWIVEKIELGAKIARQVDPRANDGLLHLRT